MSRRRRREQPPIEEATVAEPEKANLGLATTRELLDELRTRIEVDYACGGGGLDYTTVGGRPQEFDCIHPNLVPVGDELVCEVCGASAPARDRIEALPPDAYDPRSDEPNVETFHDPKPPEGQWEFNPGQAE